jgi:hypothetical protein
MKFSDALLHYEETIRIYPLHSLAYDYAARVSFKLGKKHQGLKFLEKKAQVLGRSQPE